MASSRDSDELVLADRLVGYADAITAVAFLGVSGLGVTVADPDIRCDVVQAVVEIAIATFLNGVLFIGVVAALRRAELDLRSGRELPDKVARYGRMLHFARYVVIGASALVSLVLLASVSDTRCEDTVDQEVAASARSADRVGGYPELEVFVR